MKRLNSRNKFKGVDWDRTEWARVTWGRKEFPLNLSERATYSSIYCLDGELPDRCPPINTLPTMDADTFKKMFPDCVTSVIAYIGRDQ